MLTIRKVFTILCLLYLCRNREYPSSFKNKSVGSSFKRVPKYILFLTKLKEERSFWSGQAQIYPLNYLLHVGVMLTIIKVFIILFLLLRIGTILAIFRINQLKICFQLSVKVFSLLNQTEGERKAFLGGYKKGGHIVQLPPRALGCHKR